MTTMLIGIGLVTVALGLLAWAFPRIPRRR
jgi:hypothetical protein